MIGKNIHSEIKFSDNDFKVKICTINKKNPDILYTQIGTYLKPIEKKNLYTEEFEIFDKISKKYLQKKLKNSSLYNNEFILVIDIADERINVNKKSFLDIQIHFKCKNRNNKNFKEISNNLYEDCIVDYLSFVKNNLSSFGFEYFKNKK